MRVITASNSCPAWDAGTLQPRTPGGLVPMLIDVLERHGGDWVFTAPPGHDGSATVDVGGDVCLHPVPVGEELRHHHYDQISVGLFLGLFHYLHDASVAPIVGRALLESWAGYEAVNRLHAEKLAELWDGVDDDLVLINDPHLMLVPEMLGDLRTRRDGRLVAFLGTPWCGPEYLELLPSSIRDRVLASLLRCDSVGFHAERWARAFIECCRRFLPQVDVDGFVVRVDGHSCTITVAPFPLDVDTLEGMAVAPDTRRWRATLEAAAAGRQTLVRAERLDLWKNVLRGFLAYEELLDDEPELAARSCFLAISTAPSRATGRHVEYQGMVDEVVDRINGRHGTDDRPAVLLVRPERAGSRHCVVAALGLAKAALVNSTWDGLNLFAKEAAYLMGDDATLLLSHTTGAYDQLGAYARGIDPFDLRDTVDGMREALGAPPDAAAGAARRRAIRSETVAGWLERLRSM